MLVLLAARNVFRSRGRFLLGTFVIGVASLLLVFATGQIGGVKQALERGMTDSLTGHLQVKPKAAPRDFFDPSTGRRLELIEDGELGNLLERLRALDAVEAASPRLSFGALVGDGERSTPAFVVAVEPASELGVTPDLAAVLPALAESTQAALVSAYLMRKTGLTIGDEILVLTETPSEVFNGRPYNIAGYAESPVLIDEYMNAAVLVNLSTTRRMLYVEEVATEIAIRLAPPYVDRMPQAVAEINAALTPEEREHLGVYTYSELASSVGSVGNIATGMAVIQVGAVMFVMLTIVLILTRMSLHERQAEIGTLMALGMTRSRLMMLFVLEVVMKVLIGYGAGFCLALLMLLGIRQSGGVQSATLVEQYMNGGKIMIPVIDAPNIFIGFCAVIAVSLLVTMRSCWKAGSQDAVVLLASRK